MNRTPDNATAASPPSVDTLTPGSGDDEQVDLVQWAQDNDLNEKTVRHQWAQLPTFPQHTGTRPRGGRGAPVKLYDRGRLNSWLEQHRSKTRPARVPMPADPDAFRTLEEIAKLVGIAKTAILKHQAVIDQRCELDVTGTDERYRTSDVIDVLNSRQGPGRALDPRRDSRAAREPVGAFRRRFDARFASGDSAGALTALMSHHDLDELLEIARTAAALTASSTMTVRDRGRELLEVEGTGEQLVAALDGFAAPRRPMCSECGGGLYPGVADGEPVWLCRSDEFRLPRHRDGA